MSKSFEHADFMAVFSMQSSLTRDDFRHVLKQETRNKFNEINCVVPFKLLELNH